MDSLSTMTSRASRTLRERDHDLTEAGPAMRMARMGLAAYAEGVRDVLALITYGDMSDALAAVLAPPPQDDVPPIFTGCPGGMPGCSGGPGCPDS